MLRAHVCVITCERWLTQYSPTSFFFRTLLTRSTKPMARTFKVCLTCVLTKSCRVFLKPNVRSFRCSCFEFPRVHTFLWPHFHTLTFPTPSTLIMRIEVASIHMQLALRLQLLLASGAARLQFLPFSCHRKTRCTKPIN